MTPPRTSRRHGRKPTPATRHHRKERKTQRRRARARTDARHQAKRDQHMAHMRESGALAIARRKKIPLSAALLLALSGGGLSRADA